MANNHESEAVDLTGSTLGPVITESWLGKDVSSVIAVEDISKVILLKAMTSATSDIDIKNVLKSIEKATKFESHSLSISENITWQVLLLTKQGEYIQYIANGEWVYVTLESGYGFFKHNR